MQRPLYLQSPVGDLADEAHTTTTTQVGQLTRSPTTKDRSRISITLLRESLRHEAEPELLNHLQDFDAELGRSKSIRLHAAAREFETQLAIVRSNWKAAIRAFDRA